MRGLSRTDPVTELPRKPAFGDPCNGCGVCCVATACGIALDHIPGAVLGQPCPALEWEAGRSWCGMVRRPARYSPLIALAVAAGVTTEAECAAHAVSDLTSGEGWGGCDSGPDPSDPDRSSPSDGLTALEYAHLRELGLLYR